MKKIANFRLLRFADWTEWLRSWVNINRLGNPVRLSCVARYWIFSSACLYSVTSLDARTNPIRVPKLSLHSEMDRIIGISTPALETMNVSIFRTGHVFSNLKILELFDSLSERKSLSNDSPTRSFWLYPSSLCVSGLTLNMSPFGFARITESMIV